MSSINLYKIDNTKIIEFNKSLSEKMSETETKTIERTISGREHVFSCTLYYSSSGEEKIVSWNWALREFAHSPLSVQALPKAVLVIEHNYAEMYAVTFGHSFFLVDKFCDRDFGFSYGRKLQYEQIKTTTLTSPGLQRNKVVNTYIDYNELEFNSGESFAKLKAKEVVADGFDLYKPSLEIGTSIRFTVETDSLDTVINLILHVENMIADPEDKCKIPVFSRIKDKEMIKELEKTLRNQIQQGLATINISELDIIGVTEVFNNNDSSFKLKYKRYEKVVEILNEDTIREFCLDNNIDYCSEVLDIRVISSFNGAQIDTRTIHDMIDFTIDSEKCLLSRGEWYRYNDDYLRYLGDSLAEIEIEYHPEYDFSAAKYNEYIDYLYNLVQHTQTIADNNADNVKKELKKKHYKERAFNEIRERDDGFENHDRQTDRIGRSRVEAMDLYKDKQMFAVKIGNASSKLCYVVDQSLTSLKLYKSGKLPNFPEINTVVVWIVLERDTHIENEDGKPNLDNLDLLMLKNRLDQWKKEVRLQGFRPLIWINYMTN